MTVSRANNQTKKVRPLPASIRKAPCRPMKENDMSNPNKAGGTGSASPPPCYQNPPADKKSKKSQSGKLSGKKEAMSAASLKEAVQKVFSATAYGKSAHDQLVKVDLAKSLMRAMFQEAAYGKGAALKTLVGLCKKYLPAPPSSNEVPKDHDGYYLVSELDADTIKFWKEFGYLPADCSDKPVDIRLMLLNRASREFLRAAEDAKNGG
jgi:hypothetical protein